jgi:hypothetical protein
MAVIPLAKGKVEKGYRLIRNGRDLLDKKWQRGEPV